MDRRVDGRGGRVKAVVKAVAAHQHRRGVGRARVPGQPPGEPPECLAGRSHPVTFEVTPQVYPVDEVGWG